MCIFQLVKNLIDIFFIIITSVDQMYGSVCLNIFKWTCSSVQLTVTFITNLFLHLLVSFCYLCVRSKTAADFFLFAFVLSLLHIFYLTIFLFLYHFTRNIWNVYVRILSHFVFELQMFNFNTLHFLSWNSLLNEIEKKNKKTVRLHTFLYK